MSTLAQRLDEAIKAVCPIVGVSVGRLDDKATWSVAYADAATDSQRSAAAAVVAAFDLVPRAEALAKIDLDAERARLRWLTAGDGQQQEYQQVALEAAAVLSGDDAAPTRERYAMLAASIGVEVPDTGNAATDLAAAAAKVQTARSAIYDAGCAIRRERLRLKAAVKAAGSAAEVAAILASAQWPA